MNTLFGISMDTIMAWMLAAFLIVTGVVAVLALRNRLLLKLGLRNIPRRRAQTLLIIIGLMLSTTIITSALGTGDTMAYSLRTGLTGSLGRVDEVITNQAGSHIAGGPASYVPTALVDRVRGRLTGNTGAAGVTGAALETVSLTDGTSRQAKSRVQALGLPLDPSAAFGALTASDGATARLGDLGRDEVYINRLAADALNARAGDRLAVNVGGHAVPMTVRGVLRNDNLAGGGLSEIYGSGGLADPALLLPLDRLQALVGQPGRVNLALIANSGAGTSSAGQTDAVVDPVRALLADPAQVAAARTILGGAAGQRALAALLKDNRVAADAALKGKVDEVRRLARAPGAPNARLSSLLSDGTVAAALATVTDVAVARPLDAALASISPYVVLGVKKAALDQADLTGNVFSSIFIIFSLFSIAAGVMLVFLIFVMLAAERRAEMGMARAIGTKRRHLIQEFLFEGYAYNLGAALVGVALGIGVGLLMASVINGIFGSFGLTLTGHVEGRSLVIAFCLGALLTFLTVAFSAWRISRLNVVAAIRDLPDETLKDGSIGSALARPFRDIAACGRLLRRGRIFRALGALAVALWHLVTLPFVFLSRGPLPLLLGLLLLGLSQANKAHPNGTVFRLGGALLIVGAAMLLRWVLVAARVPDRARNRIGYTLAGLGLVVFFLTPLDTFRAAGRPAFDAGPELFFIAGLIIVLGGVWAVMFNADLILGALLLVFGGRGSLAPVLKMAVSYPLQNRFRTGMTVAMFSLVIFLLMLISVLLDSTRTSLDLAADAGGFAVYGSTNAGTPIQNLGARIAADPALKGRVEAAGGLAPLDVGLRQPGAKDQSFALGQVNVADDGYLAAQRWTLHGRAAGYASDAAVWQALRGQPGYAVVDGSIPESQTGNNGGGGFTLRGLRYDAHGFRPVPVEMRDARTGRLLTVRVIGVLSQAAARAGAQGVWVGDRTLVAASDLPAVPTAYYFRVAPGQDVHGTALALGAALLANGLDVKETQVQYDRNQAATDGLFNLLEGFMALGLVVGVAALGVIAFRSVVERRQQIGMLRAIGFKRSMVRTGFLIETSFVAVLGTALGLLLGGLVGKQYVDSLASSNPDAHLTIPWGQVLLIVVIAYAASLLTTYLPAWQASRIYPAEALRYE